MDNQGRSFRCVLPRVENQLEDKIYHSRAEQRIALEDECTKDQRNFTMSLWHVKTHSSHCLFISTNLKRQRRREGCITEINGKL